MGVAVIHVVDEQAHASKDFHCDIRLLLAHSKLLAADLTSIPGHDIEVSSSSNSMQPRMCHTLQLCV